VKAIYDDHRSERLMSLGRFDLDAIIRACLGGLRPRAPARSRPRIQWDDEPHPDFEDTMPAARASMAPMP
jgi:hypothetical protein